MSDSRLITILIDGKFKRINQSVCKNLSPGVIDAIGVFETLPVYGGKIFALGEHIKRLERGLRAFGLRKPFSDSLIRRQLNDFVKLKNISSGSIRLSVWKQNAKTRFAVIAREGTKPPSRKYKQGYKALISSGKRNPGRYSSIKSLDYGLFHRARREAVAAGADEAILFNAKRHLVEGAYTNIFFIKGGALHTPAVGCGCLNGVTRRFVLKLARARKISCRTASATRAELLSAREVFVTNSLIEIMPVVAIDGQEIADGKPGKITQTFMEDYRALVNSSLRAV